MQFIYNSAVCSFNTTQLKSPATSGLCLRASPHSGGTSPPLPPCIHVSTRLVSTYPHVGQQHARQLLLAVAVASHDVRDDKGGRTVGAVSGGEYSSMGRVVVSAPPVGNLQFVTSLQAPLPPTLAVNKQNEAQDRAPERTTHTHTHSPFSHKQV